MIKGVNQSMINRSIVGGSMCKYVNGSGISGSSNGSGVNGGKITVEFTVYEVTKSTGGFERYIKKEEAERVVNEMLSVDPEKYIFDKICSIHFEKNGSDTSLQRLASPCQQQTTSIATDTDGTIVVMCIGVDYDSTLFTYINIVNGVVSLDYTTHIFGNRIDDSQITDTAEAISYKYMLYYTEV
jgi:hypothetical protein